MVPTKYPARKAASHFSHQALVRYPPRINIHKFISYIYKTEDTINIRTLNSLYNIVKYVIDSPYNLFHLSVSWKYHVTLNIQASDYMVS